MAKAVIRKGDRKSPQAKSRPSHATEDKKKASKRIVIKDKKARQTIDEIRKSLTQGEKPKRKYKIHSPKDVKSKELKKYIKKNPKFKPKDGGRKRCWEMVIYDPIIPPTPTIGKIKRRPKPVAMSRFRQPG